MCSHRSQLVWWVLQHVAWLQEKSLAPHRHLFSVLARLLVFWPFLIEMLSKAQCLLQRLQQKLPCIFGQLLQMQRRSEQMWQPLYKHQAKWQHDSWLLYWPVNRKRWYQAKWLHDFWLLFLSAAGNTMMTGNKVLMVIYGDDLKADSQPQSYG